MQSEVTGQMYYKYFALCFTKYIEAHCVILHKHTHCSIKLCIFIYVFVYISVSAVLFIESALFDKDVSCLNRPDCWLKYVMLVLRNTLNIAKSHQVSTLSCLIWKSVSKYNKYIFTWKAQMIILRFTVFLFFFSFCV